MSDKAGHNVPKPRDASVIVTYRCPMRCRMCNIWQHPTRPDEELQARDLQSLPQLRFINITGGEPTVRDDLGDIVEECYRHTRRIVLSTSGWFGDRVVELARQFPKIGVRVSLEGMEEANDFLRGRPGGWQRGIDTLRRLAGMGIRDIGFGCTVSDDNSADMLKLYRLSRNMGLEFATAACHNSHYFHKHDNVINNPGTVASDFLELASAQLREWRPKSWFRAYFNAGLAGYAEGRRRPMPCEAASSNFFIDPWGEVLPCNGMEQRRSMGNIRTTPWPVIWNSPEAQRMRRQVATCSRRCWMVGTASPVMHRYPWRPIGWIIPNRLRSFMRCPLTLPGEYGPTTD